MAELESLRTAKTALNEGLISEADFNSVKEGFVAAQKLKAGVDAGLIRKEDYDNSRDAFFALMGVSRSTNSAEKTGGGGGGGAIQGKRNPTVNTPSAAATSGNVIKAKPVAPAVAASRPVTSAPKAPVKLKPAPKPSAAAAAGPTSLSGISVNMTAIEEFSNMKSKSEYLWMTFQINAEGTQVVLAEAGEANSSYEEFCNIFTENQCKYGVFDFPYEASEGRSFNKIVFFNWAPDSAPVKQKMMFASTKAFFKQSLDGIQVELHCTDYGDLEDENVRNAIKATLTRH